MLVGSAKIEETYYHQLNLLEKVKRQPRRRWREDGEKVA